MVAMWPASLEGKHNLFWRTVAVCLSLLWFFATPILCKPYWEWLWSPFSPLIQQVLLNEMGFLYFGGAAVLMLPIYAGNYSFFEQYRICERDWDWRSEKPEVRDAFWALSKRSLFLFFFNYGVIVPILTVGKYMLIGDTVAFTVEGWPSYQTLFIHNIAMTLIHEFIFYWGHRIAHLPSLYKFHKIHHEYKQNTILASMHEHPLDYILTIASPALLAVVIVNPHSFTLFQWLAWAIVANIDDHCGYEFPWSPVRWFWMAGGTDMHEFHHSNNMGCFASKLALYDVLFESKQKYVEWHKKRLEKSKASETSKGN
jgi:sterol desaturase/sphingolipid hydroxylase (fatty acid hydroxylase superfamily)